MAPTTHCLFFQPIDHRSRVIVALMPNPESLHQPFTCDLCREGVVDWSSSRRTLLPLLSAREYVQRVAAEEAAAGARAADSEDTMAIEPPITPRSSEPISRPSGRPARYIREPKRFEDTAPPPPPRLRACPAPDPQPEREAMPETPQNWVPANPNNFASPKSTHAARHTVFGPTPAPPDPSASWYYPLDSATIATMTKYPLAKDNPGSIGGFDRLLLHPESGECSRNVTKTCTARSIRARRCSRRTTRFRNRHRRSLRVPTIRSSASVARSLPSCSWTDSGDEEWVGSSGTDSEEDGEEGDDDLDVGEFA
uniref:Uncharacterized protein n=1 Tax=Mycena chlorophos TaxID=658473 RepID=A0ABQ0LPQ9_MYCCL|nr:predicted protein [Mycena chlorophos]